MELFDVLKSRAGIPVNDMLAILFAGRAEPDTLVYKTTDDKIYADANGSVYVLKEE